MTQAVMHHVLPFVCFFYETLASSLVITCRFAYRIRHTLMLFNSVIKETSSDVRIKKKNKILFASEESGALSRPFTARFSNACLHAFQDYSYHLLQSSLRILEMHSFLFYFKIHYCEQIQYRQGCLFIGPISLLECRVDLQQSHSNGCVETD